MNATMRFIVWGTIPIGATIGGVIATAVGVAEALWIGSILACTAFLPVFLGPVRRLHDFPQPADEAAGDGSGGRIDSLATPDALVAEAAMSGLEPMGISMPRSLDGYADRSGEKRGDPGGNGGDSQGAGHGQDGGAE